MKNMKKFIALLLTAAMAVSCLAGCGGKENNGGASASGDKSKIQIKYWLSGLGTEWLEKMIDAFETKYPEYEVVLESSSDYTAVNSALGMEDADKTDLYLSVKDYNSKNCLEPLDDVLSTTVEGETKTIGEKFDEAYLKLEKSSDDGHYYNLTYGGGTVGIYYNTKMFEEAGIKTVPRTTDELVVACDTLLSSGFTPFCHFKPVGYWEDYMAEVFFMQYDGYDYVMNNFFGCTDENGNSPSLDVFTKKDGRYEALKVLASVVTPEYTMTGSNTYDHVTVQTMLLNGEAAMMVNGSWLASEMSTVGDVGSFDLMRTPVVSSIVDKLTTVESDKQLRELITAIDRVTDGEKTEDDYKQGDNYVVGDMTVSADDWAYVKAARNTMALNATGDSAYIPNYSDNIEGAKKFLTFLYSDEGHTLYAETLQQVLPLSQSEGELDISGWTDLAQKQVHIFRTTEQFSSFYNAGAHDVFTKGGARWKDINYCCNYFCSSNVNDRMTADEVWERIVTYQKENYDNWLKEVD